jgi:hypothetical protein
MIAYHGLVSSDGDFKDETDSTTKNAAGSGGGGGGDGGPPFKKRKTNTASTTASTSSRETVSTSAARTAAFLRWLVGSYHPLDMVHCNSTASRGFTAFCKSLNISYALPSLKAVEQLAVQREADLLTRIRSFVQEKDSPNHFSVSVRRVQVQPNTATAPTTNEDTSAISYYYPVHFTFCNEDYQRKSYTVAVVEGQDESHEQLISEIKAAERALESLTVDRDMVTNLVIQTSSNEKVNTVDIADSSWINRGLAGTDPICVLDQLDGIVMNAIEKHIGGMYGKVTKTYVDQQSINKGSGQNDTLASTKAYDAFQHAKTSMLAGSSYFIPHILSILTPFRDAMTTLSTDAFPTIGLTISLLRRVQSVLNDIAIPDGSEGVALFDDDGDENDEFNGNAKETLEDFYKTIQDLFSSTFKSILDKNPSGMWTMPLDPRLVAMSGLSEEEKVKVRQTLEETVNDLAKEIDQRDSQKSQGQDDVNAASSSTMGGIFWGDDDIGKTSAGDKDEYGKRNVESYFNTVRSQRRIDDPSLWWKNNQRQFPELASLARKWLGSSVVYAGPPTGLDERNKPIPMSCSNTESIVRMIFLHDNQEHI